MTRTTGPVRGALVVPADVGPAGDAPRTRRGALAVLLFLATLPLQFEPLADLAVGQLRPFHLAAVAMVLINPGALRAVPALVRELWVLVTAMLTLTLVATVALTSYGGQAVQVVQHLVYCVVGLVFALMLRDALGGARGAAMLVWAAPLTVTVTYLELGRRLLANGLQPGAVLRATLIDLNPQVLIFGVFRGTSSTGEVVQPANVRHEIVAAVVVAVLVTVLARRVSRLAFVLAVTSTALGSALVVLSLSRSVLLPLMVVALGAGARVWLRAVLTRAALVGMIALTVAAPVVGSLLYGRFVDETGSYDERIGAFSYSTDELLARIVSGGPPLEKAQQSTHTLVFDSLLQAGWVAGLAAVVVVAVLVTYTVRAYARYFTTGSVAATVAFAAGAMAVVRTFTIGGGLLHQVEWVEVGILVALAAGAALRRPAERAGTE